MKRTIVCTLLFARSILCSSRTNRSNVCPKYEDINRQKCSFTSPAKKSLAKYPNKNAICRSPFNVSSSETCKHTSECAAALSVCQEKQAMECEYTEQTSVQWQEDSSFSVQSSSYTVNIQNVYQPGCSAQSTTMCATASGANKTEDSLLLKYWAELPINPIQEPAYSPNRASKDGNPPISKSLDCINNATTDSGCAVYVNREKQAIDCAQIEQTEIAPHKELESMKKEHSHTVHASSHIEYSSAIFNHNLQKNTKRKVHSRSTNRNKKKKEEEEEEESMTKKESNCFPTNWNENRLKDSHRKSYAYLSYKPVIYLRGNIRYYYSGNFDYRILVEKHVSKYKNAIKELSPIIRLLFIISTRTKTINTKLVDCEYLAKEPDNYKFMEEIHPNYSSISKGILYFMKKHGAICTDSRDITTEWKETLGDIFVRQPIEGKYLMNKDSIVFKDTSSYSLVSAAVHMILSLPEVHADLYKLTPEFIQEVLERNRDITQKDCTVIRALHEIANKSKSAPQGDISLQYKRLYKMFKDVLNSSKLFPKNTVIQLYTRMYAILTHFYSKAEICRKIVDPHPKKEQVKKIRKKVNKETNETKKYALLHGKCMIKPQRYLKYIAQLNPSSYLREHILQITEETNRWTIKPDIKKHYHIHYVDNTKQQYKRLCMPLHSEKGCIHSIDQIVDYIQRVYKIKEKGCICPYKRHIKTRLWASLSKEEMSKTMHDLAGYHVVFYYIEEGLLNNYFTFAQFDSYMKPAGSTVPIPLFLSPLARSLVKTGPFEEEQEHAVVADMKFRNRTADMYAYRERYRENINYICIQHYYRNLYIRRNDVYTRTVDCYIMDAQEIKDTLTWYVKVPTSVGEYTHCVLDKAFKTNLTAYIELINTIVSREYAPDSKLYGFGVSIESSDYPSGTSQSMPQKEITVFELNTESINKEITALRKKIDPMQAKIDNNTKKLKQINEEKKISEKEEKKKELLKQRSNIYSRTYSFRKKIKGFKGQIAQEEKSSRETSITSFPFCSLLVFRNTNTTKSSLGSYNELFDALSYKYYNFHQRFSIS